MDHDWRKGPLHLDGWAIPAADGDVLDFYRAALPEAKVQVLLAALADMDESLTAKLVCKSCGNGAFRLLRTPFALDVTKDRYGSPAGTYRHVAQCFACASSVLLFDKDLHGWNAAVCGERESLEANYAALVDPHLSVAPCGCGALTHEVLVATVFDAEDIDELTPEQQRESFGSFAAWSRCATCGRGTCFVECECA